MLLQFHLFLWETGLFCDFCRSIECLLFAIAQGHSDLERAVDCAEGMWW
jgi:hypothetical protein